MNENYIEGFFKKCAEYGVDPDALLKFAGCKSHGAKTKKKKKKVMKAAAGDADTVNPNLSGKAFRKKIMKQAPKGKLHPNTPPGSKG